MCSQGMQLLSLSVAFSWTSRTAYAHCAHMHRCCPGCLLAWLSLSPHGNILFGVQREAARARETGAAKGAEVARLAAEKEVALREAEEVRSTTLTPCILYCTTTLLTIHLRPILHPHFGQHHITTTTVLLLVYYYTTLLTLHLRPILHPHFCQHHLRAQ